MITKEDNRTLREMPYPYNLMEVIKAQEHSFTDAEDLDGLDYTPSAIRDMIRDALTEREIQIIEMRYRDKMSLEQTAIAHNVTRERIRQIEAKALRKLNHPGRLKKYAAVPFKEWQAEHAAKERAEARLDWYLQHGDYKVELEEADKPKVAQKGVLDTTVDDMDLSVRSYNCLKRAAINTVGEIVALDYEQATKIRNLGRHSLDEIIAKIHSLGLKMKWEIGNG